MDIHVTEYKPAPALEPYVEWYWHGHFNKSASGTKSWQVLPSGYVELILHLTDLHCALLRKDKYTQSPDYTIIGLQTSPYIVNFEAHVNVFGIRFKPEGIHTVFGIPSSLFTGNYEDMTMVLDRSFKNFAEQMRDTEGIPSMRNLADTYLHNMLIKNNRRMPDYINRAAELIRTSGGNVRMEDLSSEVCISLRQLQRGFKQKLGISPKHYQRIFRIIEMHRLLEKQHSVNFTKVSHQLGYTDQAHFIREFKSITGEKPTFYHQNQQEYIINPKFGDDISL